MPQECHQTYVCVPKWFTADDAEENGGKNVIAFSATSFQSALVIVCDPKGGNVQVQFKDSEGVWFTPVDPEYTISTKTVRRFDRTNLPDMRILATGNATFSLHGPL